MSGLRERTSIGSYTNTKVVVIVFVILLNLGGIMVGISLEGAPHSYTTAVTIHEETFLRIDVYPGLYELIIMANASNTEIISFGAGKGSIDPSDYNEYHLAPGSNISSKSDRFLDSFLKTLAFENTSNVQGAVVHMEGRAAMLFEIMSGHGFGIGIFIIIVPPLFLSFYLAASLLIIGFVASFTVQDGKQTSLYFFGHGFLPLIPLAFYHFIKLLPAAICTYYCILMLSCSLSSKLNLAFRDWIAIGGASIVTSALAFILYRPFSPHIFNGQEIWNFLPIFPILVTLLLTGLVMLIIGVRLILAEKQVQEKII